MFAQFKKQVFALPLALGLVGAGVAALPVTQADAAERPVGSYTAKAKNHRPTIQGGKIIAEVGQPGVVFLDAKDADNDQLTYRFVGYPVKGISLEDNYLVFDLPETQRSGLHRVTVRVSDGKSSAKASYVIDIRNPKLP